jgi:hypothetical protein
MCCAEFGRRGGLAEIDLDAAPVGHFLLNGSGQEGQIDRGRRGQGVGMGMGNLGLGQAARGFQAMPACGEKYRQLLWRGQGF